MSKTQLLSFLTKGILGAIVVFSIFIYASINPRYWQSLIDPPYSLFLAITVPQFILLFILYSKDVKLTWRPIYLLPIIIIQGILVLTLQSTKMDYGLSILELGFNFIFQTLIHLGVLLLFLSSAFSLGDLMIRAPEKAPWIKIGLGIAFQTLFLCTIGIFLGLSPVVIWPVLLIPIAIRLKSLASTFHLGLFKKAKFQIDHLEYVFLLPLMWISLGFSFAGMIKPMAVGHDGNSVYMYLSRQIATGFPFPSGWQPFPWSVYASLPEILTGAHSTSLFFTHIFGFISLWLLFSLGKKVVSLRFSLWQTLILSMSPFLLFHLLIDEKVDLAGLFFVILFCKLTLEQIGVNPEKRMKLWGIQNSWPIVASCLLFFAISIKYTNVYYLGAAICAFFFYRGFKFIAIGILLSSIALIQLLLKHFSTDLKAYVGSDDRLSLVILLLGLSLIVFQFLKKSKVLIREINFVRSLLAFGLGILFISPWMVKKAYELNTSTIQYNHRGQEDQRLLDIPIDLEKERSFRYYEYRKKMEKAEPMSMSLDTTLAIDQNENLRYLGLEPGAAKWVSLPFDVVFNANTPKNTGNHLGYLPFLLLLLVIGFESGKMKKGKFLLLLGVTSVLLIIGIGTNLIHQANAGNTLSAKQKLFEFEWTKNPIFDNSIITYLTTSSESWGIAFLVIIAVLTLFWVNQKGANSQSALIRNIICIPVILWALSGSGILWYVLPSVFMIYLFLFIDRKVFDKSIRSLFVLPIVVIQILFFLGGISSGGFPEQPRDLLYPKLNIDYLSNVSAFGQNPAKSLPQELQEVIRRINSSNKNVYMVNTPLRYFIDEKDRDIMEDDYLGTFWQMQDDLKSINDFPGVLAHNGFEYVAYDITTPSRAGVKSEDLDKKSATFLEVMSNHPKVDLVITNNIVESSNGRIMKLANGRTVRAKPGLEGRTIILGSYAIFKINQ